MTDRERTEAAEKASSYWTPEIASLNPAVIQMARRWYAEGYRTALWDIQYENRVVGPLEGRACKPIEGRACKPIEHLSVPPC